jgi:hypothetical protein
MESEFIGYTVYCKLRHTKEPTRGELEVRVTPLLVLGGSERKVVVYDDVEVTKLNAEHDLSPLGNLFYRALTLHLSVKRVMIEQTDIAATISFSARTVDGYAELLALVCDIIELTQGGKSPEEVARRLRVT